MWKFAAFPLYDFYSFVFVIEFWTVGWAKQSAVKVSLQVLGNIYHNFQNIYKPNDQSIYGENHQDQRVNPESNIYNSNVLVLHWHMSNDN